MVPRRVLLALFEAPQHVYPLGRTPPKTKKTDSPVTLLGSETPS